MTKILKADRRLEDFDKEKLINSLINSGANQGLAVEIAEHIQRELKDGMSSDQISKHSAFLLEKHSKKVAVSYSLKNAVLALGPSGFPFEKFIAEILKEKGYQTLVGEIVTGQCAEHELDVLAFNENKLIAIEAKFHNEHGIRSDLKVALYVQARFEDLLQKEYDYGGKRKFNENWLITNTKFTSSAFKYGKCKGMTMIGWNYPKEGNLQDMIEDSGLHPLTCLTTLSQKQKIEALKSGEVLCKKLHNNEGLLKSIGISGEKMDEVKREINLVCEI
ncbi:MAG: restriction endonuclease [Candidatus Paceibacterota bacterium]|nr:MAG: restriction endonuclease [Candidatus Paceibacterota bacterium]